MPSSRYEKILATFAARAENYRTESAWVLDQTLLSLLCPKPFGAHLMLDVCGGTGALAQFAYSLDWKPTVLDISAPMLKRVPPTITCVQGHAERLSFKDSAFDLVACRQGLQYVKVKTTLKEMRRVCSGELRLGHITMIDETDRAFWTEYFSIVSPGRCTIFCPSQIEQLVRSAGFEVLNVTVSFMRDRLRGSLWHLSDYGRNKVFDLFRNSSTSWKRRYQPVFERNGDISYLHRWEFIGARPTLKNQRLHEY